MNQWQQYRVETRMPLHRQGWRGVYDAIVATVMRRPRLTVETPVTVSFWAKGSTPAIAINGISLEAKPIPNDLAQCQQNFSRASEPAQSR
jgi:hypothetical protein